MLYDSFHVYESSINNDQLELLSLTACSVVSVCRGAHRPEEDDVHVDSTEGHPFGDGEATGDQALHWAGEIRKDGPSQWPTVALNASWVITKSPHVCLNINGGVQNIFRACSIQSE